MDSAGPGGRRPPLHIALKRVTSEADVPQLANINEKALEGDPLKLWMAAYTERTEWKNTVEAVTGALGDPNYHLLKAVILDPSVESGEKIVGFVHWMCGYIHLENGYNSAQSNLKRDLEPKDVIKDVKDPASDVPEKLVGAASQLEDDTTQDRSDEDNRRAWRLKRGNAKYVETRNSYIGAIRGKKHIYIRRIMVLPEYQGHGVGRRLLKAVTDDADRQKIVCWLFARPAGEPLYAKLGFAIIYVVDMDEPEDDFVCPPAKGMMRLPVPVRD